MGKVFKWAMIYFLILAALSGIALVGKIILFPAHAANKIADASVNTFDGVVDKTLNADNVLQNYEWFKQTYEDYLAIQAKIVAQQNSVDNFAKQAGPRDKWTFEDKTEYARLNAIVDGLNSQKESMKAEYNAKSKMLNRNLFKSKDLPYQLD